MTSSISIARNTIRVTGVLQIILGIIIWTGRADGLIPIHVLVGIVLVLALWYLAYEGARAGVSTALVAVAVVWGFITPVLGLVQTGLFSGSGHWVIQVVHLLVGLAAIGLGEALGARLSETARR